MRPMLSRRAALAFALAVGVLPALAQELDPEQDARYRALINELRCLVCQNQSIADSNAPLAADLRDKVRTQVLDGRSDEEIKTYVTQRYGDFVLYRPPMRLRTVLLWIGPFVLLVLAAGIAAVHVRRRGRSADVAVDEQALKRLLEQERGGRE